MADVSDNSAFNLGLARIASDNSGPTAMANQANTNASTALTQQQTQGAAIQNANSALNLQALKIGLNQLYKMPGYKADENAQSDSSGSAPAPTSARGTASSSAPSSAPSGSSASNAPASSAQGDQPSEDDELGSSVSHPELLDTGLRNQFYINPLGTPGEQQNILQAARISALTKNPAYVQIATQQRDMSVAQRRFQAQQTANTHYSEMASVADAGDKGNAFDVLHAVAPESAGKIERMHPQEDGESNSDYKDRLNEVAADTAGHYAGHVFQYTGRETETRKDGVVVDKATGFPVAGVRGSGMSPQEYSEAIDKANAPISLKNSDGSESQIPTWKYAQSQGMPVKSAADYVKQKIDAQQAVAQHKQIVQDHFTAQRTQQQVAQGQQPGGAQPGAAPQPGAVPQPGAAGQQPQRPDNGLLPNVNPDALPKIQMPAVRPGTSQSPADAETAKGVATSRLEQMKAANESYTGDQKEGALLKAAQREAAALAANPRMAGPGSEVAQWVAKARTAVTGQAPDSLVDLGGLDKILLQLGAQNVRQALQGQKITQAEFLLMLGKGNPNTEQPLATVNKLLGYLGAQNDYDQRFNRTKQAALQRGANPLTIDSDIGAQADRGDYVESRVGVRPPLAGGKQSAAPAIPVGTVRGNFKFTGGDPSNKTNWVSK
jgi:hypothetical protein